MNARPSNARSPDVRQDIMAFVAKKSCVAILPVACSERINRLHLSMIPHTVFRLVLLITVIGVTIVELIATPLYCWHYYVQHGRVRGSWFNIAKSAFGLMLLVGSMIKSLQTGLPSPRTPMCGVSGMSSTFSS
jgi:hypothetical protein